MLGHRTVPRKMGFPRRWPCKGDMIGACPTRPSKTRHQVEPAVRRGRTETRRLGTVTRAPIGSYALRSARSVWGQPVRVGGAVTGCAVEPLTVKATLSTAEPQKRKMR